MDSQDVNPNDQPQPSKEDDISYGSIHNSMETGTISPTEILKPSALLKEESVWDSFRASSQPINHPRRTSVGDLQFRNDSEQLSPHHSQRRSSCQIGSGSMPFLFRSQSPPPSQSHPSPFLRHGSATFSSHDLTLTQQQQQHHHHYQPQAHLNHHINRPHYQLQHSHSLPATPSPLPFSWPGSSHDSGFPTLAPPPSHYVEDRMEGTFADSSAEVDHKTPPSNPFDHSEPEQPSCTSPSFSTIATPGPYTPSLSLTHYHFDLRPMNFLNDSPDKNGTENQDRSTSNQSTPIPAMFHLIRPSSQPINNPFPTRPLSANAATHHKLSSTSLQIDPSLIPDHLSTEHRFGLSKSAYDGSRRASMVEESLFSSILHREFVDTPLNSHNSGLAMPLPPMSALQSRRPSSIAGSLTEDPNTSLDSLSTAPTTANQPSGTYLPVPHSTTQRSSSLPPPVIPDSMRYLLLPSPSGSANLSPLTSTYIHGDTTSLFDEAFSAFVEPLHSSQCDSSNDLQMNFDTEIHDKDGQTSGLRGVDQSHSRGNGEPLVCLDPTPKMSLPPFSALASSSLMTESQDELITPQHNPRTRTAMEESFGSQLRRSFPDLNYVDTLKPDESGDSSLESLHDAERRGSLEAIPSPRAINGLAKSGASFKCTSEGCTKAFGRRSDLARHTRIHTGERPYPCEHTGCGKRFIQRSALTVHMRTHSGEKPHSCVFPGCDKAFADSSSLARHRRTHNKNKLYLCKVGDCEKNFTRRTALAKHLKSHDNVIGSGIGNPQHVEQHSSVIDLSETGSSSYNPSVDFLPPSRTRERHHFQTISSRSPRNSGSYVNSPLSTSMTLPEDHYPHNRYYPSFGPVHRDVVVHGPVHFSATPELMSQHRPHHVLPSTNPQLYPTSAPPSYQYPTSVNENMPCSPHFNQSNHSSPSSKSSALGTPSPSTRSATNPSFATLLCSNLVPNHHPHKPNLPSLYCGPGALGSSSSKTHEASGSSSFSPLVKHSPNVLDEKAYVRRRLGVSNGPPPPILRTHQPPPQVKSIENEPRTGRKIYEDENNPPIDCHQLPCPSQPAPSSPSFES